MMDIEPNPGLQQIIIALVQYGRVLDAAGEDVDFQVLKVQPPDGLVLQLEDGSKWGVAVHRLGDW